MGGWLSATVAWLASGSHSLTGSVMFLGMRAFLVGLGNFAHCIAASGEILAAVLTGQATAGGFMTWLGLAVAGNISGGVGMVTLLEYGQVVYGKDAEAEALPAEPKGEAKS
jgi:formate/nitrite transporter FocA (FNT family)